MACAVFFLCFVERSALPVNVLGFAVGTLFGAFLFLAGLADPDKIVGSLRLKDLHALRTIAVFVLVGLLGTSLLETIAPGSARTSVKPAAVVSILIGGAVMGIGFGLTGYCPGTGLACAVSGRADALIAVVGMFGGAFLSIVLYPGIAAPLDGLVNYGKVTIHQVTGTDMKVWALPLCAIGAVLLDFCRSPKPAERRKGGAIEKPTAP
jgi:hypothetical protein